MQFGMAQVEMRHIASDEGDVSGFVFGYTFTDKLFPAALGEQHDFVLHMFVQGKHKTGVGNMAAYRRHVMYNLTF